MQKFKMWFSIILLNLLIITARNNTAFAQMQFQSHNSGNNVWNDTNTLIDTGSISIIELRNYLLKAGKRKDFTRYFETNLINSQNELKGYVLGQYQVKGKDDNFFWIRGFENMKTRSVFLPTFYFKSASWKQHAKAANDMMLNTDNVYLLCSLNLQNDSLTKSAIKKSQLYPHNRIAVIDFYTANTRLTQLKQIFSKSYLPLVYECGIQDYTVWISEPTENDFPQLPVFQDKNLMVIISFYADESEYTEKQKQVESKMSDKLRNDLLDVITFKQTIVLYPTDYTRNK